MEDQEPTPDNATMMQGFEWYVPADGKHWMRLQKQVPQLKAWGVDNIWIPPGCKAASKTGGGYDIYDLYDIGEFDQQGSVATGYGSRDELLSLAATAKEHGIGLYWDAVLNHKFGADHTEKCRAREVDPDNRNEFVGEEQEIEAYVGFDFPGRADKYSQQKYHWYHFSGVDQDATTGRKGIFKILGGESVGWDPVPDVDDENGNYDYLMGADMDYAHPEVVADVLAWGKWLADNVPIRGIRFDAIKHYSEDFLRKFIVQMDETYGMGWFFVGEFWKDDIDAMTAYLDRMGKKFSLFDVPLVYNFHAISEAEGDADLRRVFDRTLVQAEPLSAVTFVMNHDTQPSQSLELPVADWFKPLGYALILLRAEGYPCVWYGDLYGVRGPNACPPSCGGALPRLVLARRLYAYGEQVEYFGDRTCIGWVRQGTWDRPAGCCAVVMSSSAERPGERRMQVGEQHAGETWTDLLGWHEGEVQIDEEGFGVFACGPRSVSVWVNEEAEGRERFDGEFDTNIYEDRPAEGCGSLSISATAATP